MSRPDVRVWLSQFVLHVLILVAAFRTQVNSQSCTWTHYQGQSINGGTPVTVANLSACQAACLSSNGSCQSIDYKPLTKECRLLPTKSGKFDSPGTQHYDYDCQSITDFMASAGDPRCIKSNYPGSFTDFYSGTGVVYWSFPLPKVEFDTPPVGLLEIPLGGFFFINSISYVDSQNIKYFLVRFTKNSGQVVLTDPIYPDNKIVPLEKYKLNDVRRVEIIMTPINFNTNVLLDGIALEKCFKADGTLGAIGTCSLLDPLKSIANTVLLSVLSPGTKPGTFSVSSTPQKPYIELDLGCTGDGIVTFSKVSFIRSSNFDQADIAIWIGDSGVKVVRSDGVATGTFANAENMELADGVRGDRIRAAMVPNSVDGQGTNGALSFAKFSVYGYKP